MARKRSASSELNDDNWDEFEPEEAPSAVLEGRVYAKRRKPISSVSSEAATKNVFSNFRGFTKSTIQSSPFASLSNLINTQNKTNAVNTTTPSSSVEMEPLSNSIFKSSGNNLVKPTEATTNNENEKSAEYYAKLRGLNEGVAGWIKAQVDINPLCILTPILKDYEKYLSEIEEVEKTNKISNEENIFSTETKTTQSVTSLAAFDNLVSKSNESKKSSITEEKSQNTPSSSDTAKSTFFGSFPSATTSKTCFRFGTGQSFTFKKLAKPESTEISSTYDPDVDINPLCISTPILKDNKKYLSEIEEVEKTDKISNEGSIFSTETKTTQSVTSLAAFGNLVSKSNESKKSSITEEKSQNTPSSSDTAKSTFFGSFPSASTSKTCFGFGTGQPFTFSNLAKPESTENSSIYDPDEEDEPPKMEFKRVVEDGNIYSQRCQVFVEKDGWFEDIGVGQLLLKSVSGSEKIQLVVRADTNLENLLLNFMLSESMHMQRLGENNVMLVSIPTPDAQPPPTSILLQVKTREDADELLKILEKHKK